LSGAKSGRRRSKRADGDLGLYAGELSAKTKMDAASKRHGTDILAIYVEPVRVGIDAGITIGGSKKTQDRFALLYDDALGFDVLERRAPRDLHRRIIAQQFFNCRRGFWKIIAAMSAEGLRFEKKSLRHITKDNPAWTLIAADCVAFAMGAAARTPPSFGANPSSHRVNRF